MALASSALLLLAIAIFSAECVQDGKRELLQKQKRGLAFAFSATQVCPSRCQCVQEKMHCQHRNMMSVPAIPNNYLPRITKVDLANNFIETIGDKDFWSWPNMKSVRLQNNQIKWITPKAFDENPHLEELNLYNNQLESLPESLRVDSLTVLILDENRLRSLPLEMLERAKHLRELSLVGNDLLDCDLVERISGLGLAVVRLPKRCREPVSTSPVLQLTTTLAPLPLTTTLVPLPITTTQAHQSTTEEMTTAVASTPGLGVAELCIDGGWEMLNDRCVKYYERRLNFDEAQEVCVNANANMMRIRSGEENEWLMSKPLHPWNTYIWIGYEKVNDEWTWLAPGSSNYTNWWGLHHVTAILTGYRCASISAFTGEWQARRCSSNDLFDLGEFACEK